MAHQRFDLLLQTIHDAALKAQELTEEQHIQQLEKYFDEEGKPLIKEIQVPSLDPEHKIDEMVVLRVPLLSLLPPTAIKIKELKIDFEVGLGKLKGALDDDNKGLGSRLDIDMGGSGGMFGKAQSKAKVQITFEAGDPSESFMRVNDHLIKSVV